MKRRTSATHPLQIATLDTPGGGRIGLILCPGKRDYEAMIGPWERDLMAELNVVVSWGACALVTLMEAHELGALGVPDFGEKTESLGMRWYHLPIRYASIPDPAFEKVWGRWPAPRCATSCAMVKGS